MKNHNKRVLSNTIFLYGKLVLSAVLTLYSTRVLLSALGIQDFGIYNLIAGVVIMLTFINGAMIITTQRYLSFYLGAGDSSVLNKIFNTSVYIHFVISVVVVLVLELLSLFLFDGLLNIPPNKSTEAIWCFHLMVASTFFTVNSVPYDSLINAKEDMLFDSVIGLIETFLKFVAALAIGFVDDQRLVFYSVGIVLITVVIRISKSIWCKIKYHESVVKFKFMKERFLFKEMLSYASWNLFGSLCYVASSQGIAVVLNRFMGVGINGTYAISQQMNSQLQSFSVVIGKALNPQIVKSEGAKDRPRMIKLALLSSKSSALLLLFIIIPLIAEISGVLNIWLENVPPQAAVFCTIILINSLVNQMSTGLKSAVQATGQIKLYQSIVGSTIMLIVPLAYILLSNGYSVFSILLASTGIELLSLVLRVIICNKKVGITYRRFFKEVFLRVIVVAAPAVLVVLFFSENVMFSPFRILLTFSLNAIVLTASIFLFGINSGERTFVITALKKIRLKKIKISL